MGVDSLRRRTVVQGGGHTAEGAGGPEGEDGHGPPAGRGGADRKGKERQQGACAPGGTGGQGILRRGRGYEQGVCRHRPR